MSIVLFSVHCLTIKDVSDFPFVAHSTMFFSILILVLEILRLVCKISCSIVVFCLYCFAIKDDSDFPFVAHSTMFLI